LLSCPLATPHSRSLPAQPVVVCRRLSFAPCAAARRILAPAAVTPPPSHRRPRAAAACTRAVSPALHRRPHTTAPPSAGRTQPRRRRRPHTLCTATVCRPRARAATSSPAPGQTLNPAPPCHSLITIPPPLLLRASPAPHCVACGPYIALAPPRHHLVPPAQNRHRTAFC
jgi:hypothetical protein